MTTDSHRAASVLVALCADEANLLHAGCVAINVRRPNRYRSKALPPKCLVSHFGHFGHLALSYEPARTLDQPQTLFGLSFLQPVKAKVCYLAATEILWGRTEFLWDPKESYQLKL